MGQRVALYARVSTADQCCERQVRELEVCAARAGHEIVGLYRETGSGTRTDRRERRRVLDIAQRHAIDAVLVTELSRWGRSTPDLLGTLADLEGWGVSLIALNGMTFDLATAQGRTLATVLSGLAAFERDLTRERVLSGLAAAKARGKKLGRQPGPRPSDRLAPKVLAAHAAGRSYRWIARDLGLSKNTVMAIVRRSGPEVPEMSA
ncbi:MAG: recombinase family protein [Pseudomonadota bacterium]